jgi:hypothetical protein
MIDPLTKTSCKLLILLQNNAIASDKFDKNDKITTFMHVFIGRINKIT